MSVAELESIIIVVFVNLLFDNAGLIPCETFHKHRQVFVDFLSSIYFSKAARVVLIEFTAHSYAVEFIVAVDFLEKS